MKIEKLKIENPIVICFENDDGNIQTHLYPKERTYHQYGILITDIVRHVAKAYEVNEDDVWEWVDKERYRQTSPVTELKPN
ncbi:MAG: hypothetical protein WAK26_12930 [Terracidiphilus sp.]